VGCTVKSTVKIEKWSIRAGGDILIHRLADYTLPQGKVYMIQILESNIYLKTDDTMGQVSGGSLTLRGWLRSFELNATDSYTLCFVYRGRNAAMIDIGACLVLESI
jgi:hypothetical protein